MDRRHLLTLLARAGGVGALGALAPDDLLALGARVHAAARGAAASVLTPAQRAAAVAAMDIVVPRTDTPGATDARAVDFLEVMLASWFAPAERDAMLAGLGDLDARAVAAHRVPFARAAPGARLALLGALDAEAQAALARRPGARSAQGAPLAHWFAGFKFVTVWGWATARPTMEAHGSWPLAGRYDADAPVRARQ